MSSANILAAAGADAVSQLASAQARLAEIPIADAYWTGLSNVWTIYRVTPGSGLQIKLMIAIALLLYFSTPYFLRNAGTVLLWLFGTKAVEAWNSTDQMVRTRWYIGFKLAYATGMSAILLVFVYWDNYVWTYTDKLLLQSNYYAGIVFALWTLFKLLPVFVASAATGLPVGQNLRWRRWFQLIIVIHASKLHLGITLSQWSLWAQLASAVDIAAALFERPSAIVDAPVADAQTALYRTPKISRGIYPLIGGLTNIVAALELICATYDIYALTFVGASTGDWQQTWLLLALSWGVAFTILVGEFGSMLTQWVMRHSMEYQSQLVETTSTTAAAMAVCVAPIESPVTLQPILDIQPIVKSSREIEGTGVIGIQTVLDDTLRIQGAAVAQCDNVNVLPVCDDWVRRARLARGSGASCAADVVRCSGPIQAASNMLEIPRTFGYLDGWLADLAAWTAVPADFSRHLDVLARHLNATANQEELTRLFLKIILTSVKRAIRILTHLDEATASDLVFLYRLNYTAASSIDNYREQIVRTLSAADIATLRTINNIVRQAIRTLMERMPQVDTTCLRPFELQSLDLEVLSSA